MHDNRLGRRLAPLALWLMKANPRKEFLPEQIAQFHERVPTLSHEGVEYKTPELENQFAAKSAREFRQFKRDNPNHVLTAYDKARTNGMRALSNTVRREVKAPDTLIDDDQVKTIAQAWAVFHDGDEADPADNDGYDVTDIKRTRGHGSYTDPFKYPSGTSPSSLVGRAVARNGKLRDAKHNPVLSNDQVSSLMQGLDNLELQGRLDVAGKNHAKVFRAYHEIRTKKNPNALTTVGSLPEAMLPHFAEAAGTLGPEGTALQSMFRDAQQVFTDLPLPTEVRGEVNNQHRVAKRRGFAPIGQMVETRGARVKNPAPRTHPSDKNYVETSAPKPAKPVIQRRALKNEEPAPAAKVRSFSEYKSDFDSGKIKLEEVPESLRRFLNKSFAFGDVYLFLSTLRKA